MKSTKILSFVAAAVIIWGIASVIDVNLHNSPTQKGYENYASWNVFAIIEKIS